MSIGKNRRSGLVVFDVAHPLQTGTVERRVVGFGGLFVSDWAHVGEEVPETDGSSKWAALLHFP